MTFYEEFGVSGGASAEEIREVYKRLVRLLHPDILQDEKLRQAAECQLRRINTVYETLSNAEKRRHYDRTLHRHNVWGQPSEVDPELIIEKPTWKDLVGWLRGPAGAWTVAAGIGVFLIVWIVVDGSGGPGRAGAPAETEPQGTGLIPSQQLTYPVGSQHAPVEQLELQIAQLRRRVEEIRGERDAALERMSAAELRLRTLSQELAASQAPPLFAAPAVSPPPSEMPAPLEIYTAASNSVTGNWYFPRTGNGVRSRDLYPPEFIEAVITEDGGVLQGKYRARFRVSDRAISPEVIFQFSGKAEKDAAKLPWLGTGGARGEVRLRLLTQNTLEVAWIASDLGQTQGLGSGTAVLVRRHDP